MKKRIIAMSLALVFVLLTASIGLANVGLQSVSSSSNITASGRTVGYSGLTRSSNTEPNISVSITLKRLVDGQWQYVDSTSNYKTNSSEVSKSDSCTVTGGYYYKAFATHCSTSGGTSYTESKQIWVA